MKVLVIGGSYFLGRVFTMLSCDDYDLTLVNRGRYSMQEYGVKEYHFDRHDINGWKQIQDDYDVIVDFCAYEKGDIEEVVNNMQGRFQKYIFISTVDVYHHGYSECKDESYPFEERIFPGDIGNYIKGKVALEKELVTIGNLYNIDYVAIRPGNIYGPMNYAPREIQYIARMASNLPLYELSDANANFPLVYVKDVALAIKAIVQESKAHSYNIVSDEIINYQVLNKAFLTYKEVPVEQHTVQEAIDLQYPLIYPVYKEEEENYDGSQFMKEYNFTYTKLEEGIYKTCNAFYPILLEQYKSR